MLIFKKTHFLSIKLPDIHLSLAFAIVPFYHQYNEIALDFYHILYIPLIAILVYAIVLKKRKEIINTILTILLSLGLMYLHSKYNHHFPWHNNSANEIRETLFSMVAAYYALVIYKDSKSLSQQQLTEV